MSSKAQWTVNWALTTVSYPLLLVLVLLAVKEDKAEEEPVKQVAPSSADNGSAK